jgi:hypothetical protein
MPIITHQEPGSKMWIEVFRKEKANGSHTFSAEEVYHAFINRLEAEGLIDTRSLAKATLLSVWKEVVLSALFSAIFICTSYVGPIFMDAFVQYLNGNRQFRYQGYALAASFL